MSELSIKKFGPIDKGCTENSGFITISPVTVICGNQATGKSTIAKLYSTFCWLEKSLMNGTLDVKAVSDKDFFCELLSNQRISEYLSKNSEIEFRGSVCNFLYKNQSFTVKEPDRGKNFHYVMPQIMYIPSERNLLTAIENAERINNLPLMLSVLSDEYDFARKALDGRRFKLPVSNTEVEYDSSNLNTSIISPGGKKINILNASSGIQSVTPLSIVSEFIAGKIKSGVFHNIKGISALKRKQIRDFIKEYYSPEKAEKLESCFDSLFLTGQGNRQSCENDPGVQSELLAVLTRWVNSRFVNIVEEPEQNLFPESQRRVLNDLLGYVNSQRDKGNSLMLTTHSPYILSFLTLDAKGGELKEKGVSVEEIAEFVPEKAMTPPASISVYETRDDGSVLHLAPCQSLPSDKNILNHEMLMQNERFADLLELEERFCR